MWRDSLQKLRTMRTAAGGGEYWGKLMRGACMTWQYTGDQELYKILREAVLKLLDTQDEEGRISTYSRQEEFNGWDIWCRKLCAPWPDPL